ncbi:hypothetical protein CEUSTIGMA_g375.t1 [Chlamydomonas eustigma]|uniref:ABC transporter domain-containing protein n=1 Tax=Chlamydomonas eustigma TaxID=1157962 RepID=A0A250WQU1_9CHLO|nr:hypothetical protein CEUSTIGMA_g375.t1 [Chlamydomonas eustigma]|eukprot:GAX72920.1 hypothetical protein CEUSTIGMA_g375.t1 [Chlamydomonas eustigma]
MIKNSGRRSYQRAHTNSSRIPSYAPGLHPSIHTITPAKSNFKSVRHVTTCSLQVDTIAPLNSPPSSSTDLRIIYNRLASLALPYWTASEEGTSSRRWKLAGVVGLTLATTGVSVVFNYLGRDFFNALSEKDPEAFSRQLLWYMGGFVVGIPVFVFKSYFQGKLALEWRQWLTEKLLIDYFSDRSFYQLQAGTGRGGSDQDGVDNPDQRISSDVAAFTDTALGLSLTLLNAFIDLISFSGILFSIYPPLFAALVAYSVGGTVGSLALGKNLVTLNFDQEAREADFRYNLVRVRENAESVAFYRGEANEQGLLVKRLAAAVQNYMQLLTASRNLEFFTSFYRYFIQLLPAAVVAPLFFQGKIEFGVINQSTSAFNHILTDLSLVVYQFESLAGFSAVIDRLGQFQEVMLRQKASTTTLSQTFPSSYGSSQLHVGDSRALQVLPASSSSSSLRGIEIQHALGERQGLVTLTNLTLQTPDGSSTLVRNLSLKVAAGQSLLIMGPSGTGKTSIMRALAGLWKSGSGQVALHVPEQDIMFLPQRPYMVVGTLRDQLLYPKWHSKSSDEASAHLSRPSDEQVVETLKTVRLGALLKRYVTTGGPKNGRNSAALDAVVDWSASLSVGEQQRIAWARLLLANPKLALLDEATSALDGETEEALYEILEDSEITYISIGHRPSLKPFHKQKLSLNPTLASAVSSAPSTEGAWELKAIVPPVYRMM